MKQEESEVVKRLLFQIPVSQLAEQVKDGKLNTTYTQDAADVLARHHAIAFADFLHKGNYVMTSHGKWEDEEAYSYTTSELYDLWIKGV